MLKRLPAFRVLVPTLIALLWPIGSVEPAAHQTQQGEPGAVSPVLQLISGTRMLADIAALSGHEFEGRQTGTTGDLKAADFVARRFTSLGLSDWPSNRDGTPEELGLAAPVAARSISQPRLEVSEPGGPWLGTAPQDYLPILDSPPADVTAPVLFVGYGISDPSGGYDEYAGLDAKGKIVLFLRGKPDHYPAPISHADKERLARDKGAVAFLTVTGPVMSPYEIRRGMTTEPSAMYGGHGAATPLPGAWISPNVAEKILASGGFEAPGLRTLQETLIQARRPQSRLTSTTVRLAWEATEIVGMLRNVTAAISGQDPALREDVILVGAHRDHFGRQAGLLFPGADDNASGTAIILEIARVITESGLRPKRTIVFVSFSGEEQGMLGSRLYVSKLGHHMARPKAMINIDHAGIGNGRLTVGVTEVEKHIATEAGERAGLADRVDLYGFFPGGDHVPFKEAGVPTVTVVSGGPHPHFHKPTDTVNTVKPEILQDAARYVLMLLWQLANHK